jgi:hypothetical protein
MKMVRLSARVLLVVASVLPLGSLLACQKTLFDEHNSGEADRLNRFYDGDSAQAATEMRRHRNQMGFGFPAGLGNQN